MGGDGKAKPPAIQFYGKEWIADTRELDPYAKGMLIDLIMANWINGDLPTDLASIARITGSTIAKVRKHFPSILNKFSTENLPDGRMINRRVERQRNELKTYNKIKQENGRKGAKTRWAEHGRPMVLPSENDGKPIAEAWQTDSKSAENGMANAWRTDDSAVCSLQSAIKNKKHSAPAGAISATTTPTPEQGQVPVRKARNWAFDATWTETLQKPPGHVSLWPGLITRIETSAALLKPPRPPGAYASELIAALPEFVRWALTQPWDGHPSVSVRSFDANFERIEQWVLDAGPPAVRSTDSPDPARKGATVTADESLKRTKELFS